MASRFLTRVSLVFVLIYGSASAQLQTGDIMLVDLSQELIRVDVANAGFEVFTRPPGVTFGSSVTLNVHSVLWVPDHPNDVLVGGGAQGAINLNPALNSVFGFATANAANHTVTWQGLPGLAVGIPAQMSLDNLGRVIVVSQANWAPNYNGDFVGRVRRVDLQAGTVTDLTPAGFFLPSTPTAGVFDPWTDDIYIGTAANDVYRWDHTTGNINLVASIPTVNPGFNPGVSGIALDPFADELIITVLNDNQVVRMTPTGQITSSMIIPGGGLNGVTLDENGDVIVINNFTVTRIPQGGGPPVVLASFPATSNLFTGVTVVGGMTRRVCQPDLGGASPQGATLMVCGGDLTAGTVADIAVSGALPLAPLVFVANFAPSPFPLSFAGGSFFPSLAAPFVSTVMTDAQGRFFASGFPGGGGPASLYLQGVAFDPSNPVGWSLTNAVRMDLLP